MGDNSNMSSESGKVVAGPTPRDRHRELLTNIWLRGHSSSSPVMATASSSSSPREPLQTSAEVLLKMKGKSYDSDDNMFDPFSRDMLELMEKCRQLEITLADRDATIADLQQRRSSHNSSLNTVTVEADSRFFAKPAEEGDPASRNAELIQRLQNQLMREVIYCTKLEAFGENAKNDMILAQNKIDTLAEEVHSLREVLLHGREMGLNLEETKDKAMETIKELHTPLSTPPMSSKRCTKDCIKASSSIMEQQELIRDLQQDKSNLETELKKYREECKTLKERTKQIDDEKISKTTELTNELMELRFQNIHTTEEITQLQAKYTEAIKTKTNAVVVTEELNKELMECKKKLGDLEGESKSKSDQMYIQKKAIERLELEIKQTKEVEAANAQILQDKLQSLQLDHTEKDILLGKNEEEMEVLQAELQIRMADVERLTAGLSFSSGEVKKFSEEINNLKNLLGDKENELSLARQELSEMIEKHNASVEQKCDDELIDSDINALNELKITLSQRDTEIVLLNEQFDMMQDELRGVQVERATVIQETLQLKKSLNESMEEQSNLKADAVAALEKLKKSKSIVKEMESRVTELNHLEDANKSLKIENDEMRSNLNRLEKASNKEDKLEESKKVKSLQEQLETSMEENNALSLRVDVLQTDIDELNQVLKERESELLETSAELSRLMSTSVDFVEPIGENEDDMDILGSSVLSIDESFEFEVNKQELVESKKVISSLNEQLADRDTELEEKTREIEQLQSKLLDMKIDSIQLRSPSRNGVEQKKSLVRFEDKSTSMHENDFDKYSQLQSRITVNALVEADAREKEANMKIISLQADLDVLKSAFDEMQNAQAGTPMAQQDRILRLEESVASKSEEIQELRVQLESSQRALSQSKESYTRLAKFKTDLNNKKSDTKNKYSEEEHVFLTTVFLECREMLDAVESVFDSEVASMHKYVDSMKTIPDPDGEFLQIKYDGLMNEISTMLAALASTKENISNYGEYIQQKILDSGPNSP